MERQCTGKTCHFNFMQRIILKVATAAALGCCDFVIAYCVHRIKVCCTCTPDVYVRGFSMPYFSMIYTALGN